MELEHLPVDRRKFFRATASAAALALPATSYAKVMGSLGRVNVGFIGCGGRAQAHIHLIVRMAMENQGVTPMAVCDVWDGATEEYDQTFGGTTTRRKFSQGLYPSAEKCGLNPADRHRVVKDYRRLLDLKDVDAVCISTPDHWHARQTLDAISAGKDVYVERPMTRTAAEADAVRDAAAKHNRVVTVGYQSLTDPTWQAANQVIQQGRIGTITQAQTGVFRNDIRGQWRFYRMNPQMNPKTIRWDLFLGHQFEVNGVPLGPTPKDQPFQAATFAQWRCYRPFSGGPLTDLLSPAAARLLTVTGSETPKRVTTLGGLYVENDGRTVPDVATVVAELPEGGQLVVMLSTASSYPLEEVVRGRRGTIKFVKNGFEFHADDPRGGASLPARLENTIHPTETVRTTPPKNETEALWQNFLQCVRDRNRNTIASVDIGAKVSTLCHRAVITYESGKIISET